MKNIKSSPLRTKRIAKTLIRILAVGLALLIATPFLLTLVYLSASVHPYSILMIKDRFASRPIHRQWVELKHIAPILIYSVMMSEDATYCSHHGVDWKALNLVINKAFNGKQQVRGASTLSMQTARNLFLWNGRSYIRKALEIPLALYIDWIWSKNRLLEIYLNIAEWGPSVYGIEAAAQHYFKRSANRLSDRQAALLAVTLPNPHLRNPAKPSHRLSQLAMIIKQRALHSGAYIGCLYGTVGK